VTQLHTEQTAKVHTFRNDQSFEPLLLGGALHDRVFNSVGTDEVKDKDGLCLANPVGPILCLSVYLRVLHRFVSWWHASVAARTYPILVVEDNSVSRRQIDA
jgi:hypothetical protein